MVEVLAKDGDGVLEPRAYQLEMLRDSMQRNIIVAVSWSLRTVMRSADMILSRWTQAPARPKCKLQLFQVDVRSDLQVLFCGLLLSLNNVTRARCFDILNLHILTVSY